MLIRLYIAIIFFVLAYFSQIWSSGSSTDDVYPLFSWSLFSYPESVAKQYYIYVPDKKCELPLCEPREEFWDHEHLVQQIGHSYTKGDQKTYLESKQKLEKVSHHISNKQTYELRFRILDPVEYVKYKKTIKDELIVRTKSLN